MLWEGIRSSDNHHLRITGSGQSSWSNSSQTHTRHGTARRETEPSGPIQSVIPPRSPSSLRSFHSLNRKRRLDFPRFFSLFGVRMTIDISVFESWKFVFAFCPFDLISVSLAYLFVIIEAPQTKCTNLSHTAIVREKSYWRIILYYNLGQQRCVWWWGIRSSPFF